MTRIFAAAAALALALSAPIAPAYAELIGNDVPGNWIDVRHHLSMHNLPANSEAVAALEYAQITCRAPRGTPLKIASPHYFGCLKAKGYVFIPDSAAEIAARQKVIERAQPPVVIIAPAPPAIDFQPHGCNGFIGGGGGFSMNCN
jgi:hypothetical protein